MYFILAFINKIKLKITQNKSLLTKNYSHINYLLYIYICITYNIL